MLQFWRKWRESRRQDKALSRVIALLREDERVMQKTIVDLHAVYYEALLMAAQNAQKEGED